MEFEVWLTLFIATSIISISPGAGAVVSMNYGLNFGYKRAMVAVSGLQIGLLLQTSLVVLGLGSLIATSVTLFTIIKWVGVIYLLYLGLSAFFKKVDANNPTQNLEVFSVKKALLSATFINLTNPKATVFLVAFIPQFLDPAKPLAMQFGIICLTLVAVDVIVMSGYSSLASKLRFLFTSAKAMRVQNRVTGGFLCIAALFMSFAKKTA